MSGEGNVVFLSRTNLIKAPATSLYSFNDDGTNISYQNAVVAMDDTVLLNKISVTRTGGTTQTAYDQIGRAHV